MASTYTDSLKLELQETGANANTWGNNTNTNLQTIDAFNAGYLSKSVAGSANVTLTSNNADPNAEASNKVIEFTGTLTGNIYVFIPAVENNYIFFNNTSGAFTLTIAPTGHSANGVAIVQGAHTIMYNNANNEIVDLFANSFGQLSVKNQIRIGDNITLNANGVVSATTLTGDGSGLTGVEEFESGTEALFVQTSSPTGFTTNTSATLTQCCLQVVNGSGGGTGGSDTFSSVFGTKTATSASVPISTGSLTVSSSYSIGATTLSTPQIAAHTHPVVIPGGSPRGGGTTNTSYPQGVILPPPTGNSTSGSEGGGGSHTHSMGALSLSGSLSSPVSASLPNMNLKYADSIVATKD